MTSYIIRLSRLLYLHLTANRLEISIRNKMEKRTLSTFIYVSIHVKNLSSDQRRNNYYAFDTLHKQQLVLFVNIFISFYFFFFTFCICDIRIWMVADRSSSSHVYVYWSLDYLHWTKSTTSLSFNNKRHIPVVIHWFFIVTMFSFMLSKHFFSASFDFTLICFFFRAESIKF